MLYIYTQYDITTVHMQCQTPWWIISSIAVP